VAKTIRTLEITQREQSNIALGVREWPLTAMPRLDVVYGSLIYLVKNSRRQVRELRRRTIIKMHGKKAY